MNKTNILLLSYFFTPDLQPGVQRAVRFAKYLPRVGYDVHVIAHNPNGSKDDCSQNVLRVPRRDSCNPSVEAAANIAEQLLPIFPNLGQLPWIPHAIASAEELIAHSKISAIISTVPPLPSHLVALWLKKRHQIKWIADFRDPLLGNPGRTPFFDIGLERLIFESADIVTAVTDAMVADWKARYRHLSSKFHVMWNGFDPEENMAPRTAPPKVKRVITHFGRIHFYRDPSRLFSSTIRLIEAGDINPDQIQFRLIGPCLNNTATMAHPVFAALYKLGCISVHYKLLPRPEALELMATSDILWLLDTNNVYGSAYAVPSKLFEYVRVGRPVIASTQRDSPVDMILRQCGVSTVQMYDDDTDSDIDRKLLQLLSGFKETKSPSKWFLDSFDGRQQAVQMASLLDGLLSNQM